ncbi:uncharacterized protein LOC144101622 [Amblyomma americanum]
MIHAGGSSYAQRSVSLSSAATSTQHQSNHQKRCCNFGKRQGPTYDSQLFLMPCRVFEETSSRRALFIQRLSSNVDGNRSKNIQGVRRSLLPSEYWALLLSLKPQPCLVPRYHSCSAKAVVWPFVAEQQQPVIVAERERKIRDSPLYAAAAGSSKVEGHRVHGRRRSSYPRVEKVQSGQLPHKIPSTADPSTRRPGEKNLRSHRNLTRPPEQPGCRPVLHLESKARNLPPARPHLGEVHADLAAPAALRLLAGVVVVRLLCTVWTVEFWTHISCCFLAWVTAHSQAALLVLLRAAGATAGTTLCGTGPKQETPPSRRTWSGDKESVPTGLVPHSSVVSHALATHRRGDEEVASTSWAPRSSVGPLALTTHRSGDEGVASAILAPRSSVGPRAQATLRSGDVVVAPTSCLLCFFIVPRPLATQRSGDEEAAPTKWMPRSFVVPRPLATHRSGDVEAAPTRWVPHSFVVPRPLVSHRSGDEETAPTKWVPRSIVVPRALATHRSGDEEAGPTRWVPYSFVVPLPLATHRSGDEEAAPTRWVPGCLFFRVSWLPRGAETRRLPRQAGRPAHLSFRDRWLPREAETRSWSWQSRCLAFLWSHVYWL